LAGLPPGGLPARAARVRGARAAFRRLTVPDEAWPWRTAPDPSGRRVGGLAVAVGSLTPYALDVGEGVAELVEPRRSVLADELDAPRQRLGSRSGHPRIDEGVEDEPVGLPQPGHDGRGQRGEHVAPAADPDAPGHLASGAVLEFACDA